MFASNRRRLVLANAFASAAVTYWLDVFPSASREVQRWRGHARRIPDPMLRRLALNTQNDERGNLEGAAAFAVLVPPAHREGVVRAAISFQAIYDYIDTLAEQPSADPVANGHQLHLALLTALDPSRDHADYYRHSSSDHDSQYIRSMIDTCREACSALPSYGCVAEAALEAARRMATYQSLAHGRSGSEHRTLARWATALTPPGYDLRWWETAASAASSLGVFALIAAAAKPNVDRDEMGAMKTAYFPWIGALHLLLDGLIDRVDDHAAGHHNLMDHYSSAEEAASRLGSIASRAMKATESVPQSIQHAMILAAMTSFYLSSPAATAPGTHLARQRVLETMGTMARPAMAVLRTRRFAGRALAVSNDLARRLAPVRQRPHALLETQVLDFPLV